MIIIKIYCDKCEKYGFSFSTYPQPPDTILRPNILLCIFFSWIFKLLSALSAKDIYARRKHKYLCSNKKISVHVIVIPNYGKAGEYIIPRNNETEDMFIWEKNVLLVHFTTLSVTDNIA